MRDNVKQFLVLAAQHIELQPPIYEFGSLQVPGQEGYADLRPLFPGKEFVGCDMREGTGVDKILNLHSIDLPSDMVGTVICLDTLEHVEFPHKALEEIHRILKPSGVVIISSVMDFPVHDFPHDYWRFTTEAFSSLLRPFRSAFVGYAGKECFPHTVVGIGFKGEKPSLSSFVEAYEKWRKAQSQTFRYNMLQVIPPCMMPWAARVNGLLNTIRLSCCKKKT
jgi:SAM-dependent methyltransferase